jgi:hypothetical protein
MGFYRVRKNKIKKVKYHITELKKEKPYPTQEIGAGPMRREIL